MKDYFRFKSWTITFFMFVIAVSLGLILALFDLNLEVKKVEAGSGHNVMGFAWSSNYGWISFNSMNCDTDGDGDSDGGDGCPTVEISIPNYGVNLDTTTGEFSGYAWSQNLGYINFAPGSGYLESPTNDALVDMDTGAVSGWALMGHNIGNDYWLKMSGPGYRVTFDNDCAGDFSGFAWGAYKSASGMGWDGIGWVSFNSNDCDANGDGKSDGGTYCPSAGESIGNYKVHLKNWSGSLSPGIKSTSYAIDACVDPLEAVLSWELTDDSLDQAGFYFELYDDSSGTTKLYEYDGTDDVGHSFTLSEPEFAPGYDKTYYWRVNVTDVCGNTSVFSDLSPVVFPDHKYPVIDFTWVPENPQENMNTVFTDSGSLVFDNGNSSASCNGANCLRKWSVSSSGRINGVDNATSTTIIFDGTEEMPTVTLTITDLDTNSCAGDETIKLYSQAPYWFERKPK